MHEEWTCFLLTRSRSGYKVTILFIRKGKQIEYPIDHHQLQRAEAKAVISLGVDVSAWKQNIFSFIVSCRGGCHGGRFLAQWLHCSTELLYY